MHIRLLPVRTSLCVLGGCCWFIYTVIAAASAVCCCRFAYHADRNRLLPVHISHTRCQVTLSETGCCCCCSHITLCTLGCCRVSYHTECTRLLPVLISHRVHPVTAGSHITLSATGCCRSTCTSLPLRVQSAASAPGCCRFTYHTHTLRLQAHISPCNSPFTLCAGMLLLVHTSHCALAGSHITGRKAAAGSHLSLTCHTACNRLLPIYIALKLLLLACHTMHW